MTEKKLAANRQNALKSTGPKTASGKAVSSRNSAKHGLLAEAPIISGVESRMLWERHRDGVLKSIAPVGYVEKLLTIRLAVVLWKIWRVVRYEAEVSTAAVARAESDLEDRAEDGFGKPADPATAREKVEAASLIMEMLETLPNMAPEARLEKEAAEATLWAPWCEVSEDFEHISIPGVPDDEKELTAFDNWTAGLLSKGAEVYAAAAGMTPETLLNKCMLFVGKDRENAEKEERDLVKQGQRWKLLLERENRSRMLLEPEVLDKVARYESNLERSFFRILHEIQRLQASRCGAIVAPPAAIDLDLTVHSEGSS